MKKSLVIIVLTVFVAGRVYGQLSVGGGVAWDTSNGNGYKSNFNSSIDSKMNTKLFGGYIFIDFSYFEINAVFGSANIHLTKNNTNNEKQVFNLNLIAKLPLDLGFLIFYPALGVDAFIIRDDNKTLAETLQIGFLTGAVIDFPIGSFLFLRAQAFFAMRFPDLDMRSEANQNQLLYPSADIKTVFGMGSKIMIGAGIRIF